MKTIKLEKKWQEFLEKQSESGMGYHKVDVTFEDGTRLEDLIVRNAAYLEVSIPYTSSVSDLQIHGTQKVAIRMRIKPPKRRTGLERLKSRLYYRRNRAKIRMQRRRYLRKHRTTLRHRRLFLRYKPPWLKRPKKPKPIKPKTRPKFKIKVPQTFRRKHSSDPS